MEDLRKKGRGRGDVPFFSCRVNIDPNLPGPLNDLLYDPQTSGGLLISLPSDQAQHLLETLKKEAQMDAWIVGQVVEGPPGKIQII
jgi:selenide,water dikinase